MSTDYWKKHDDNDGDDPSRQPIIVHIAGASGSGKSHLGELLAKLYGSRIAVKDTDEFYQHGTPAGDRLDALIADQDKYMSVWLQMRRDAIDKFIAENRRKRVIVFVGLLDHMAPREREVPFAMEQASVRFFIKIRTADLLRQYYTRVQKYADANPRFWADIVNGKDRIDSSDEKQKDNRELWFEHKAAGYVHAKQDDILAYFAEQLFRVHEEEIMLVANMDMKSVRVEKNSQFLLTYSTSAIHHSSFVFSMGLFKTSEMPFHGEPVPGAAVEHTMLITVAVKKFPSIERITETIKSPIPGTPPIVKQLTVYVDREPTGRERKRAPPPPPLPREHPPIHFADSGYIYGTKYSITVTETKEGKFHAIYDGQVIGNKDVEFTTDAIWQVADDYVVDGTFHKDVPGIDTPTRCADCGYALVHYRGLVAKPEAVGRLMGMVIQWFGTLPP